MSPNRSDFLMLEPLPVSIKVYLGDEAWIPAVAQGKVRLVLEPGLRQIEIVALFVPSLGSSLLSVGQLSTEFEVKFTVSTCFISRYSNSSSSSVVLATLKQGLWKISAMPVRVSSLAKGQWRVLSVAKKSLVPSLEQWHQRLGHLNVRSVRMVVGKEDIQGDCMFSVNCSVCMNTKQQRRFEKRPVKRASEPFELVHSDLCGPISVPSHGGAKYFIVYVDDFSRHTWVFILPDKSSTTVTSHFQEFTAWIWTNFHHLKYKIRRFRCDNGKGKYNNCLFLGIQKATGIQYEPASAYTQHKNGVSKRMIRTITTKARAVRLDARLHQQKFRLHHLCQPCILTQAMADLHPERTEHPDTEYVTWLHPVNGYHPP